MIETWAHIESSPFPFGLRKTILPSCFLLGPSRFLGGVFDWDFYNIFIDFFKVMTFIELNRFLKTSIDIY